jgi:hypothetical protein
MRRLTPDDQRLVDDVAAGLTRPTAVEPDALAELHVELQRLDAFVRAYQSMSSDPERRRALNYLRDRFPGPTVMRGAVPYPLDGPA